MERKEEAENMDARLLPQQTNKNMGARLLVVFFLDRRIRK